MVDDDVSSKWNDIVNIFVNEFGSTVRSAFDFLKAEATSDEVNVEGEDNWIEVNDQEDILDDVNGEIGTTSKGRDGTIRKEDHDKGPRIFEDLL